jgi:hypothetical protein
MYERVWIGLIWLKISPFTASCEHVIKFGFFKGEILDFLSNCQVFKKDSAPCD